MCEWRTPHRTSFHHSMHQPIPPLWPYLTPIYFHCIFRYAPVFWPGTLCCDFKDLLRQKCSAPDFPFHSSFLMGWKAWYYVLVHHSWGSCTSIMTDKIARPAPYEQFSVSNHTHTCRYIHTINSMRKIAKKKQLPNSPSKLQFARYSEIHPYEGQS